MLFAFLLQASDSFNCFSKATLSSEVTSKILTLNLESNGAADCAKYYNQNNSAELEFSNEAYNEEVHNFSYSGGLTSINFDYQSLGSTEFMDMLEESLVVFEVMLVNVEQIGSITRVEHTYINATNCWSDVSLTYSYLKSITLGFTPLNCELLSNEVNINLEWRIGETWSEYNIFSAYTGFNYATDTSIVIDSTENYYNEQLFEQFFKDLDKNITLEARMTLSYDENGLEMLIVSAIETIKTDPCLDLLKTTSYLSRYYVEFNFDTSQIGSCIVGDPTSVEVEASALGVFLKQTLTYDAFIEEGSVLLDVPDELSVLTDNTELECIFIVTFEDDLGNRIQFYKIQDVQLSCLKQIEVVVNRENVTLALFRIDAVRCHFTIDEMYDTTLELVGRSKEDEYSVYVLLNFKATLLEETMLVTVDNTANTQDVHIKSGIKKLRKAMKNGDEVHFIMMNLIEREVGYNLAFSVSMEMFIWFAVIGSIVLIIVVLSVALISYRSRF